MQVDWISEDRVPESAPYVKDNATGLLRELDSHGNQELSLDETGQWSPWKMRGDITQEKSTKGLGSERKSP